MILTNIHDCDRYAGLHPAFPKLFEFLRNTDLEALPNGKVELDGDDLFVKIARPEGKSKEVQPLEMHRQYIDVQFLISGKETIGWKATETCKSFTKEYTEEKDCALSNDPSTAWIDMVPGDMVIVWPEDAHAPAISDGTIHKAIGKVRI